VSRTAIYRVGPKARERVLQRMPRAKGGARLRAIITGDTKTLLSYLEKGLIAVLKAAGLPLPDTNRARSLRPWRPLPPLHHKDVYEDSASMLAELWELLIAQ